jgi:hypothetical protein
LYFFSWTCAPAVPVPLPALFLRLLLLLPAAASSPAAALLLLLG